jgi:hypothetical protein
MRARTWIIPALAWVTCDLLVLAALAWVGWDLAPRMLVVGQVLAVATAAIVFIGGRVLVARASVGVLAAVAVTAAAVAACPVPIRGSDGCNTYDATTHAALVPYVLAAQPKRTRLAYGGVQTLIGCWDPERRPA